jgi:hypothetical protein
MPADAGNKALSGFGERDAAGRAVKESGVKTRFQPGDGIADCRCRHVQFLRRSPKTPTANNRHHHFQLNQT